MNIFNKITLQSMIKSRTRTIVTIIGVILSAAMITAVTTFAVSLQNYVINGAVVKYGGWHAAFLDVPSSFAEERSHDAEAEDIAIFENIGYAMLEGGQNLDKPYLFIAGFNREAFNTLPITLLSGRLPENSREVLIPAHIAANGGVKIPAGSTLSLSVGNRLENGKTLGQHDPYVSGNGLESAGETLVPEAEKTYTVVGICERPAFEEYTAPGYTLITAADQTASDQAALNQAAYEDSFSVFVTLKNPRAVRSYAGSKAAGHDYILNDDVLRFMGLSGDTIFNTLLYSVGGILAGLIMLGSIFLIYNSFTISLNDRMRQFGILLSVGATEKQLQNSVLFEGLCIGAVGIPIGILTGLPCIGLVISLVDRNFRNILYDTVPLTLTVSVPAIAAAAAVSMAAILVSAWIPARKAAGTPVMECIRQTNEVKVEVSAVKTIKSAERFYGLEGTLALKNFRRNKRRCRSIVLSLTLSVVLFVSANAFGTHLKQAASRSVVDSDYDICFYTQDMDDDELFELYEELRTAGDINDSSYQAVMPYSCTVQTAAFSDGFRTSAGYFPADETLNLPMDIQFIEDSVYLRYIEDLGLPAEEYTGPDAKMTAVAKAKQADDAKEGRTKLIDMFADRSMNFHAAPATDNDSKPEQGKDICITFVDTIPIDTLPKPPSQVNPYVFMAVAPYQLKGQFESPDIHTAIGLTFLSDTPSQSVAEMERMIQGAGITSEYTLYNTHKMLGQNRNIIFIVDLFTYVFVIMISLIATANVFNTISTNIRLRRRELAMLRSVGMSDRSFQKMMNFECFFYGGRTLLFGIPAAGMLSWLIYKGLAAGGAEIDFMFPWGSMGISVLGVFLVIFITMLYSVSKIKKENIIDALRDDIT